MEKGRILELQGFAGSVARGSIDLRNISRISGVPGSYREVFWWMVGPLLIV